MTAFSALHLENRVAISPIIRLLIYTGAIISIIMFSLSSRGAKGKGLPFCSEGPI